MNIASIISKFNGALRNFNTPREVRLGLSNGFPINTIVYALPKQPSPDLMASDILAHSCFYHAGYVGNNIWRIGYNETEYHGFGSDIIELEKYMMSTQEMISLFNRKLNEYPNQPLYTPSDYRGWGTHFSNARSQIETLIVQEASMLESTPK